MEMPNPHPLFDHENFHFEQLRQIIIRYAIHANSEAIFIAQVKSCRLVCSDWLQITSQVLRQCKKPLFHLKLDQNHALQGKGYFNKISRKLELNLMEIGQVPAPPVALTIQQNYPVRKIARQLDRFRNNFAWLNIAVMPKSSRLLFPNYLRLPLLRKLCIKFTEDTPEAASLSLESVFNTCPELKVLKLNSGTGAHLLYRNVVLPADLTRVTLPETLQTLTFYKLETQHFEALARIELPQLKKLQVVIPRISLPDGLFTRVLENFKSSLERLIINGDDVDGNPGPRTCFRFPVMEKLYFLHLESAHLELESGIQSLENFLPKLTRIMMIDQTPGMLKKWTQSQSQLPTVTSLHVIMHDENSSDTDPGYSVNLNKAEIREMAHTFPKLKDLSIFFGHSDYSALTSVWQQMTQLESLRLFVEPPKHITCQDHLTSGLLGVTLKMAADLRTKRAKRFQLRSGSIKQMSNLRSFRLEKMSLGGTTGNKRFPLLSDSVFEMAFNQMPQLENIFFTEPFWAARKWING